MKNVSVLKKLGVSAPASTIYLALLKNGQGTISQIATATGQHRPAIYRHLPELMEQGLVSQSRKGQRTLYVAESPEHLLDVAKRYTEELESALPDLVSTYRSHQTQPMIRYFQGQEGIRSVYEDFLRTIKKGDVVYRYESPENHRLYEKYIPKEYRRRVLEQGEVDWLIITNKQTMERKRKRLERIYKSVPPTEAMFMYDISEYIYGHKVAFIDYRNEVASIIESKTFAGFQRKIFKMLFDRL